MEKTNNNNFAILALVAIVAVIGIVSLIMMNTGTGRTISAQAGQSGVQVPVYDTDGTMVGSAFVATGTGAGYVLGPDNAALVVAPTVGNIGGKATNAGGFCFRCLLEGQGKGVDHK